jgi:hypothetical protein
MQQFLPGRQTLSNIFNLNNIKILTTQLHYIEILNLIKQYSLSYAAVSLVSE